MSDAGLVRVAVQSNREQTLEPGESFHTLRTFVSVHQGDYFRTLTEYRRLMMRQGFQMVSAPDSAFGPIWCAWGYGRSVQLKQVYDTLPTAKKLGFSWVTLDDGWQNNYGDWELDPKKPWSRRFMTKASAPSFGGRLSALSPIPSCSKIILISRCSIATAPGEKFPGGTPTISAPRTGKSSSTTKRWFEKSSAIGDSTVSNWTASI